MKVEKAMNFGFGYEAKIAFTALAYAYFGMTSEDYDMQVRRQINLAKSFLVKSLGEKDFSTAVNVAEDAIINSLN